MRKDREAQVAITHPDRNREYGAIPRQADPLFQQEEIVLGKKGTRRRELEVIAPELMRGEEDHPAALGKNPEREQIVGDFDADQVGERQVPGRDSHHVRRSILCAEDRDEQAPVGRSG
jgi:hypothetical protein